MSRQRRPSRFLFFFIGLALVVFFGGILAANGKKWYDRYQQEKEIRTLQEEITRLKGEERQKRLLLEQLKSPFFIEREGREKFGAKKPGETVVLFPKNEDLAAAKGMNDESAGPSFFKHWMEYFFHF